LLEQIKARGFGIGLHLDFSHCTALSNADRGNWECRWKCLRASLGFTPSTIADTLEKLTAESLVAGTVPPRTELTLYGAAEPQRGLPSWARAIVTSQAQSSPFSVIKNMRTTMPFSPDIIVTGEETPKMLLVVEAKLNPSIRKEDESQLKSYMLHMRCPIGLLVTPDQIRVFRDNYTAHSENSVERVGSFAAPKNWDIFKAPHHGSDLEGPSDTDLAFRFEGAVKSWLEQPGTSPSSYLKEFPKEARETLTDYVVPALTQGVVRSSGPRESIKSH